MYVQMFLFRVLQRRDQAAAPGAALVNICILKRFCQISAAHTSLFRTLGGSPHFGTTMSEVEGEERVMNHIPDHELLSFHFTEHTRTVNWISLRNVYLLQITVSPSMCLCVQTNVDLIIFGTSLYANYDQVTFTRASHALSLLLHDIFPHTVMPLTAHYDCTG